jgi:rod shape-determining protein MreB
VVRRASTNVVRTNDLGIDIGSANAVVASASRGVLFDEPSCVAFESRDRRPAAFGYEAAAAAGRSGDRFFVVRPLSRAKPIDIDALHSLLLHVVRTLKAADVRYRSASIAVATALTPSERSAIRRIWTELGVKEVVFVPDVVAAAFADRQRRDPEKPAAVVDIGAEVSSWGLVDGGVLKEFATWELGARDLSEDLIGLLQRRYCIRLAKCQAESVISSVGCRGRREPGLTARVGAKSLPSGAPLASMVSATDVLNAIGGRIVDLSIRLSRFFESLPEATLRCLLDSGVQLVGGGALVPGLAEELHARTGLPMVLASHPLHTAALGAARFARS